MVWTIGISRDRIAYMDYVQFLRQLNIGEARGERHYEIDLSGANYCHPDGMAPLIATIRSLVSRGRRVQVVPPSSLDLGDYFETVGWMAGIMDEPPRRRLGADLVTSH